MQMSMKEKFRKSQKNRLRKHFQKSTGMNAYRGKNRSVNDVENVLLGTGISETLSK